MSIQQKQHQKLLLIDGNSIFPMINQLEINPLFQQIGLSEWCKEHGMIVQSWGSVCHGEANDNGVLCSIASKYRVTLPRLCLKWNIQIGNIPIFSSTSIEHIKSNLDLDFNIDDEDMEAIRELNTNDGHRKTWWYPRQQMY